MSYTARREGLAVGTDAGAVHETPEESIPKPHGFILAQVFLVFGREMLLLPVGLMLAADSSLVP